MGWWGSVSWAGLDVGKGQEESGSSWGLPLGRGGGCPGRRFVWRGSQTPRWVWVEMLEFTQGKGQGWVATGVWGSIGSAGEQGVARALMGSGRGYRLSLGPRWGVQPRTVKGAAEEVEGVGATPGPRMQPGLLSVLHPGLEPSEGVH